MYPSKLIGVVVIIFSICLTSNAQTAELGSKADHDALRALKEKAVTAINSRDINALSSCMAKEFIFTAVDQTPLKSITEIDEYYKKNFDGPAAIVVSMKCEPVAEILTRFTDNNTGICYGSNKEFYKLKSGSEVTMNTRWTAVVVRENGEWKVAALHSGINFMDNPLLNKVAKAGYTFLVVGLIAGIIIGILFMIIFRRINKLKTPSN